MVFKGDTFETDLVAHVVAGLLRVQQMMFEGDALETAERDHVACLTINVQKTCF